MTTCKLSLLTIGRQAIASISIYFISTFTLGCIHNPSVAINPKLANSPLVSQKTTELIYNPTTSPTFSSSSQLDSVVDEILAKVRSKKLPTTPLSITLINVKNGSIAQFQGDELRYPASVVKLFWMVNLQAQIEKGIINNPQQIQPYLTRMTEHSDNDAAAYILDRITDTRSGKKMPADRFKVWLQKRQTVNNFFELAGYKNININQKTFPVYSIGFASPQGTDLQMRGNPRQPIRNKITTNHAARLIYEILQKQAISPSASRQMQTLLTRNLDPKVWKNPKKYPGFNPVRGFLGEGLVGYPVKFASKAGWTSSTRGEAAYISSTDGTTAYVIAIIGDDRAYANNSRVFPEISRLVYARLTKFE